MKLIYQSTVMYIHLYIDGDFVIMLGLSIVFDSRVTVKTVGFLIVASKGIKLHFLMRCIVLTVLELHG